MDVIADLTRRARRRILLNRLFAQLALAACVAVGATVILLVAGTQWFDWPWLVGISVMAAAAGTWRALHGFPSPYQTAQRVDRGAGLKDSLSTALFYAEGSRPAEADIREAQRAAAARLVPSVDLRTALPLTAPRSAYALAGLVLVASSLFALRYGIEQRIDLRPSLAKVLLPWLGIQPEFPVEARDRKKMPAAQERSPESAEAEGRGKQNSPEVPPLEGIDVPEVDSSKSSAAVTSQDQRDQASESSEQEANASEDSESQQGENGEMASNQKQNRGDEGSTDRKPTNAPAESTLMSKLRDAMQNLMSKLQQQPNAGGTPQASKNGQQQARGQMQQQASGQQQGKAQQGQNQSGADGQESREGQGGEQAGNAETAQGKSSSPGSDDASRNPSSGIGKQDGNKDARLAEQLAAMGKISEIIGKRSASITGEISVEVRSSSQQLRTAYTGADSQRADRGGEVHRDEVPVALEHYVQQYFAEVRKQGVKPQ